MVGPLMYVTSLVTSLTYLPTSLPLDSALLAERKWKMENGRRFKPILEVRNWNSNEIEQNFEKKN